LSKELADISDRIGRAVQSLRKHVRELEAANGASAEATGDSASLRTPIGDVFVSLVATGNDSVDLQICCNGGDAAVLRVSPDKIKLVSSRGGSDAEEGGKNVARGDQRR
jgi:hypothetical protein